MKIAAYITLAISAVMPVIGSTQPETALGACLVLGGVLMFCTGAFLMVAVAALEPPVFTNVDPWRARDEDHA